MSSMAAHLEPDFGALEAFLPSFLHPPGSLRDAVDATFSPRRIPLREGTATSPLESPRLRHLRLDASRVRQQTVRSLQSTRAQESEDVTKMPEIVPAVLPKHLNFLSDEKEGHCAVSSKAAEALSAHDFFQKDVLQEKMKALSLSDHFDSFGKARFHHLGLAFAAKQLLPQHMAKYSSKSEKPVTPRKGDKSAKAFIMSQEALAEDQKKWTEYTKTILDAIQETDRHKDEAVKERQVAILFAELPTFLPLLPSSVSSSSLELELNREEDSQLRWLCLRQNSLLRQPQNSWRFRRNEVLMLLQVMKAWTLSSWPKGGAEMGMDRSTFCRFVLDVGLVDQYKVPYFWAVHLFDLCSKTFHFCAVDDGMASSAPLLTMVSWWDLFPIVDHLAQQHFKTGQSNLRVKFIEHLAEIGRLRLPSFALKAVNISKENLELMHQGVGIDDEQMTITTEDETGKRIVTKSRSLRALNEKGSNKVQLGILEEAAKQRMKSLLVEPEVLQLLWQHEEIFKGLNAAYADDRGHMSFAAVVQLCSDFSLAPKLISLHALRKIYESLEALDVDADEFRDSGSLDMMKAKSLNPTRVANGRGATRRSSIQQLSSSKPQAESSPTSLPRRSSLSLNGAKKRSTITTLDKKRSNMTSPVPSASTGASPNPSPVHSASLGRRRNSMQANFGTTSQERSGLMLPWEVISMRLREAAKNEPCSAFMRTPALMELLCKVAFSYLGCYGNMQQRSMSTVTQTVWLLVYMRFTVEHVRSTLQRRGRKEDHYGSLGRAVKRLRPEMWKLREAPEDQDNLPASVRPIPREVVRQTTKQAAEAPKEGTPYIADKVCVICKSVVEPGSWGNLRCFGCSKVDRTAFRRHPLVALLRCSGEKPVALAGKAPRVRNTSLSPVPFQENDILRPEENDLDVVNSRTSSPLRDGSFASSSQRS